MYQIVKGETLKSSNMETSKSVIDETLERGASNLWSSVNHIAIVVSDVGKSLTFYVDVVGMKQVSRPNFDRL